MAIDKYGWLFRGSPTLVLALNASLECEGLANAWRDQLKPEVSELDAISASALIEVDVGATLDERLYEVLQEGHPIEDMAVGLITAQGRVRARIDVWRAAAGGDEPACVIVTATPQTNDRSGVPDFDELQSQNNLILDAAGEGIYGLDAKGQVTFGNLATEKILGWDVASIIGQRSHDVHHHSHADGSTYPRDECPIYAALTDGDVHTIDNEVFWHADGHAIPVEYTSTPILKDGQPAGAVVVFRDVSERKELEQQRAVALEEIKQLTAQLAQERDYLRDEINLSSNFGEIIGASPALKRTLAQIEAVGPTPVNVLVLGESGVGKEMIARAIHTSSDRSDGPLVKVNCASIPKELFESEFFGHIKGAFTGAHRDRVGRLQLAHQGTLFLDEIGEVPLAQQGKLLRALQEQEFERVGDEVTSKVDVRVVAATNRNLSDEVKAGRFREDLFYRLSVFPIEVPPLRDRIDDIAPLAVHFLELICRELGREPLRITQQQLSRLKAHAWPGNIRELKNVVERAVISTVGSKLRLDLALPVMSATQLPPNSTVLAEAADFVTDAEFRELEKANTLAALQAAEWRVWGERGAAALLGIKPSTLTYRMKMFGLRKAQAQSQS